MKFRYENLRVSEEILDFIDIVYLFVEEFPDDERYALKSQIRRASTSIYLNIAEGSARKSNADFARFIRISLGSLLEVHAGFKIANRRGYINTENLYVIHRKVKSIWFKLCALRDSQKNS